MQPSEQLDWLVRTKLQPPPPRSDAIHRPRLLTALHRATVPPQLILLSAPAGYGKTTLLSDFVIHNQIAWLSLDEGDNDPALFLAYLIAALQRLEPACGITAQALLAHPSIPNPGAQARRIIGALINDVLETISTPFALVLDDLHLIAEPSIHLALDYLLEHMPSSMRVVIATRRDPPLALARLRARGQLVELRAADLHFTLDETTVLLNEQLNLNLSPDDLSTLQTCTEGWPAGLRLLAGSLARIPTRVGRTAFITRLAHTDRHVFDFLADEVLSRQLPVVRTFLLKTSILPELTSALCNAVTGRSDAETILEDLDRRSLFLIAIPSPSSATYRYHALFAEFLRRQLAREMPEHVSELHRRAAEAQGTPVQAIGHYLAAEMWEPAAQAIEQVYEQLLQQGLLNTLTGWIHALPQEVRDAHRDLTWLLGDCALLKGEVNVAQSLLEQTLQALEADGDKMQESAVLTDMATNAFMAGDLERASTLAHRALAHPAPRSGLVQLLMVRGWTGYFQGEWERAEADFAAALAIVEESDESFVWLVLAFYLHVPMALLPGGLERIEHFCHQATARVEEPVSPLQLVIEEELSFIHLLRGRLEQAIRAGERALAIKEQLDSFPFLGLDAVAYLAVIHAARRNYGAADRLFDNLFDQIEQVPMLQKSVSSYLYILGRTRWMQGHLEKARQAYTRLCEAEASSALPQAPMFRLMLRGLLEMAERRYAEAGRTLREAASLEQEKRLPTLARNARLLLAHLYLEQNHPQDALAELEPMLILCEQRGTPGIILQQGTIVVPVLRLAVEQGVCASFAAHLLDLLGVTREPKPVSVPDTGETLTRREVEVLRLLAAGASNRTIAEQLVISEGTVKSHVHHIFGKLNVRSRTEAAARARALHLI